ncbi:hypothetical protein [Thermoleptolyngbya sp.]
MARSLGTYTGGRLNLGRRTVAGTVASTVAIGHFPNLTHASRKDAAKIKSRPLLPPA